MTPVQTLRSFKMPRPTSMANSWEGQAHQSFWALSTTLNRFTKNCSNIKAADRVHLCTGNNFLTSQWIGDCKYQKMFSSLSHHYFYRIYNLCFLINPAVVLEDIVVQTLILIKMLVASIIMITASHKGSTRGQAKHQPVLISLFFFSLYISLFIMFCTKHVEFGGPGKQ